jgi:polysaccharide export outer membrane protein
MKIVFALFCTAALCCAQTEAVSSSGTPPSAKEATAAPVNPEQTGGSPAGQSAAPSSPQPAPPKPPDEAKVPAEKAGTNPASAKKPYVIGPMDVLIVKVWNQANLSGPADVGPDGMISMSLIGQVKADGLTARQLEEVLTQRLKEFLNSPEVNVTVAKVNSKRFFVYGEVGRPGEYPLVQETTIMDALSNVGGFRDFANKKKIYIQRILPSGESKTFNFNYNDVSKGKHLEENIVIENGDRIFVN